MVKFSIVSLMDYDKCYDYLSSILHPAGLHCPCGCKLQEEQRPHKYRKNGLACYKCKGCGKVFNIFTETIFKGIHYTCIQIVLLLRGFAQGKTTLHLSEELELSYNNLLNWRHQLQELAYENRDLSPLTDDEVVESDEVFQNAGEKGTPHPNEEDPPRVRANKKRGIGTYENDRPPIHGLFGRQSKQTRLNVCLGARIDQIQPTIEQFTDQETELNTDESKAYNRVSDSGRVHKTVCHSAKEFARDEDGDGFCEVHCNSCEGLWTGVRNFLRPFRGIHKRYLAQYVAMFENGFNFEYQIEHVIRAMIVPNYFLDTYASP